MLGGHGKPGCFFWIGDFKKEGKIAKKIAKKITSKVK